jgi:hypothetical protein
MAGGVGLGIYGMNRENAPTTAEGVTLTGEVSPADKADAARKAKEAETATQERETNNPTALKGSMPSGGMTAKEYDTYLNQALNNRKSSINQGLQGMMGERQRQMDNDYNRVRDAEMTRQNALPQPSVMRADGSVTEATPADAEYKRSSMGDRVRNTANDNALAWHAKQNGMDVQNNYNSGVQSGKINASGTPTQATGNRTSVDDFMDSLNPYHQALNADGSGSSGLEGEAGPEGPSALEDASNSLLTAGAMSDEALKVAQLAKSQGGVGKALKAIGSGKGNLAGLNAAGGGAYANKAIQGLSAVQGVHGASKEIFGKGFGDMFGDEDPESWSSYANSAFGGNDPTSEGRRANAYGNMQNRFMTKMGLSDQWKQRLSSLAKPLNRYAGAMDAFADPFTGGGLDVVRGSMASMFGDDKFAKESGYDMDPYGAGRLMSRAMKTTPSWQKTKYNGQQP